MYLYIHIPFCKKKCNYCDFVSYAGKEALIEIYVNALTREIDTVWSKPHNPLPEGEGVGTIFFGGGTPTLLEPRHFERLLETISPSTPGRGGWGVRAQEITIECNPGTADRTKLKALRAHGINRLSIGAQSFNDRHLKTLGRIHDAKAIFRIYEDARSAGFDNINLDLIFALPGQTLEEWKSDLQTAIDLGPNHLSTYNLQLEENTPLWELIREPATERRGSQNTNSEETELAMYEYTIETLATAGYKHYEISNFAKPGYECRHNINYWRNGNYIGVGAGAHSHVNGKRWSNPNCIETYMRQVSGEVGNEMRDTLRGTDDVSHIATAQRETLFLGLRLLDGVPTDKFIGFEKEVSDLIKDGMLEENNGNYRLTRKGLYLGNLVFEKFV